VQWDDLRVFLAIAQAGSLRRAARVLGFGQPTVIRHLRQLEQSLGVSLLKRTKITERNSIDLRMDVSNFFNHPTFQIGDQTATSTTFGKITTTFAGSRVFQFLLQYRF